MIALATALALLAVAPAPKAVDGPVAVMPFRNLNADANTEWLRVGIAETMISDLKKSGKIRVVEREQVDKALTEITLQSKASDTEESTAAKVGKLVGAKTIVVGSFQKAGKQLRINARFVAVETGEVLDTAKATGALADPFAVQDQVTAALLGVKPAALPKRKPPTTKTLDAYRLYAMALTTASDADRAGFLQQSLDVDPDFVYSAEALDALKKRMGVYEKASQSALTADQEALYAKMRDLSLAERERASAAGKLEDSLLNSRRFHTLVKVAGEVYDAHFAKVEDKPDPSLYAQYCRVYALHQLRQYDLALQYGEAFLKEFPGGWGYDNVDRTMKAILEAREVDAKSGADYETQLAKLRSSLSHERQPARFDFAPCLAAVWARAWAKQAAECTAVAKKYENATDPEGKSVAEDAMFDAVTADGVIGHFDEGREWAKKLADSPDYGESVRTIVDNTWPTD